MAALANLVLWHLSALFVDVLLIALRWAVPCCPHRSGRRATHDPMTGLTLLVHWT